ncbi:hypothetical protein BSKO_04119 [Bryopsis sp. KO-2023]|nr:hypothetical protein BSKO_04119 [Bryopsis sp. KO-2023]
METTMRDASWLEQPCIMGIDEAGRGPVLGAMVYACAFCPEAKEESLKKKGFADSKVLKAGEREALFQEIVADPDMEFNYDKISAKQISTSMLESTPVSLNALAVNSTFKIISQVLEKGVNIKKVFVDTLGDPATHQGRLSNNFPGIEFTVCPKADAIYPIVSAASIVAKVTRDADLAGIEKSMGFPPNSMGSGYPGDPDTVSFLKENIDSLFGYPELVRFSWSTCKSLLEERGVKTKWECDQEEDNSQQKLTCFAKRKAGCQIEMSSGVGRHTFFRVRRLQRVGAEF